MLKLPLPTVVGEINSVSILRTTLLAGIGHTIQAQSAFLPDLETGVLQGLPIRSPDLWRTLALCSSRRFLSRRPRKLSCVSGPELPRSW